MVALFLSVASINAQKAEAPDNKYEVGAIKWMKMSDAGTLIVSTAKGIYGIKPNESSPSFLFDKRKNIKQENFKLQPNTPYAMFIANGMNGVTFVIDIKVRRMNLILVDIVACLNTFGCYGMNVTLTFVIDCFDILD